MRLSAALSAVITVLAATTCTRAAVIAYDDFYYPDGSLIANSDWTGHSGTVNFSARLDVVAPNGTGDFTLGIAADDADAIWANDLSFDITYRAIVRYDQLNNIAQLRVDASTPTDPSILGDDKTAPGDTIQQFALRQSFSSETETVRVDGLVVGTAFSDVVTAIPESAALAMMGLSAGLLVFLRRRR